jgi:Mycothiol maleylpyruvate isomerase N-terminal domain
VPADHLIATFLTAQAAFTERVHAIADDQWQIGTPDAQWAVADLVWHLTDEHRWAGPLLAGLDMDQARAVAARSGPAG